MKFVFLGSLFLIIACLNHWHNRKYVARKKAKGTYDDYDRFTGRVNRIAATFAFLLLSFTFFIMAINQ